MFTGIVEEIGKIQAMRRGAHSMALSIQAKLILSDLKIGDSVSVNGICLTATETSPTGFTADVMHETLNRSTLGKLQIGSPVNLERAMVANGRFGGHIVSGHIDGTGQIIQVRQDDNAIWYTIQAGPKLMRYIIEKGSIAIDGISLTIASVGPDRFSVSLIPHTAALTVLGSKRAGDQVNLENDIVGKYIEKLMQPQEIDSQNQDLTLEFLMQNGF